MSTTRYDLCLVYDDDADQWSSYVTHHLGRDHFRFHLLSVTGRMVLDWLVTSRDRGAAVPLLREAYEARAFIVVVSPGLVALMTQQPQLDFHQLVQEPRNAQVSAQRNVRNVRIEGAGQTAANLGPR